MAHILLVDDDDGMRGFLKTALERAGHTITACADGLAAHNALTQADTPAIDLLLTDIVMPGMDGIELSQHALALKPDTRVMYITGFGTVSRGALPDGAQDAQVLSKPLHLSHLVAEVDRLLKPVPAATDTQQG
jgi:two-component system cell cycle response regulator CpdR